MSVSPRWNESLTGLASVLSELAASAIEPILATHGAGFGTFDLLAAVRAAEGRESQGQIATRLGIAPSSLTEAVASAVKKGFVEQLVVASNQRSRRLMLTREGERLLDACLEELGRVEERVRSAIGDGRSAAAIETLKLAVDALAANQAAP